MPDSTPFEVDSPAGLFRIPVEKYHEMVRAGLLTTDDRCELIDGLLVAKAKQTPRHAATSCHLADDLYHRLPAGIRARTRCPITLARSEPEPDLAVVRGDRRAFADRHPGPADTLLVVEVSDVELAFDRTVKGRIYAEAGIPEYWVVNIEERIVEVYTSPNPAATPAEYTARTDYPSGSRCRSR
jgi:Uma2 family endonuclease